MSVAKAATNGGKLNNVHAEFRDGYIFAVKYGKDYIPVVFTFVDALCTKQEAVLATGKLYHKELMRSDGGVKIDEKHITPLFSWSKVSKVLFHDNVYGHEINRAQDVALENITFDGETKFRCDRTYWTPNKTIQNNSSPEPLIGFSQKDPRSCDVEPDKCNPDDFCVRVRNERN